MIFSSEIKSSANSNQINSHFDPIWMEKVGTAGWKKTDLSNIRKLHDISNIDIPNIQPDYFLTQGNVTAIIEIEKSNEKTIWFDFMKILMLVGPGIVDFGLLLVPRNYAHKTGVWNLFEKARYYRSCLLRFAKVDQNLLSKIAIIGYRQEANISGQWLKLDSSVVINIKKLAQKSA
jgi:hypothetical protein